MFFFFFRFSIISSLNTSSLIFSVFTAHDSMRVFFTKTYKNFFQQARATPIPPFEYNCKNHQEKALPHSD